MHDYAKYWYVLGAIALDVFLLLGLAQSCHVNDALGIAALLLLLVALTAVEIVGFFRFWPRSMRPDEGP